MIVLVRKVAADNKVTMGTYEANEEARTAAEDDPLCG